MMGEVLISNLGSVLDVNVVAPKTKPNDITGIGVSTTAVAVGARLLALRGQSAEVDLY
jgi:hypothetical protein